MDNAITLFSDFHSPPLQLSNVATSSLFLMSSFIPKSEGIIPFVSAISLIPSYNWFFALTPFEAIFLGLIIAQICVLNAIGVLPVNLNQWFKGSPAGRKKRHASPTLETRHDITRALMNTLERVDREHCFLRALCLVQMQETEGLPKHRDELASLLHSIKRLPKWHRTSTCDGTNDNFMFSKLYDAIGQGSINDYDKPPMQTRNATSTCERRYNSCPATDEDIYGYIDHIKEFYLTF